MNKFDYDNFDDFDSKFEKFKGKKKSGKPEGSREKPVKDKYKDYRRHKVRERDIY